MSLKQIFYKLANDVNKYPNIVQLCKTLDHGFKEVSEHISEEPIEIDDVPTSGSTNAVSSGGVYSSEQDIYEVMGIMGAKNLLPITLSKLKEINTNGTWAANVYSFRGCEATVNIDAKGLISNITVNRLSTDTNNFVFYLTRSSLGISDSLILSGCPDGGSSSTYRLRTVQGINEYGTGAIINGYETTDIYIRVESGYNVSNAIFKPMVRKASDTDSTYQPYAMTNAELTAKIAPIACDNSTAGTYTLSATVDSDGNVTYTWS